MAAPAESGGQEFLAVTTVPSVDAVAGPRPEETGSSALPVLPCSQLPLPYSRAS